MVKGAFARFDHDHWFDAIEGDEEATRCRDLFDFDAPLGPLGWIAEKAFLEKYMRRFLEERMRILEELATGDSWSRFV